MTRYIDADDFRRILDTYYPFTKDEQKKHGFADMAKSSVLLALVETPTVDAAPVRHAKWEDRTDNDDHYVYCSECGDEYIENDLRLDSWVKSYFKYCPNCGTRMDEE